MGSSSSTTIFLILLVSIVHLPPPSSHLFVSGDSSLIRNTCKNTNNYKLCVTSLRSDSSSLKADTKGLAAIIIRIAMTHANQTNSFLSSQLLSSTSSDPLLKKVVKDCADEYSHAMEALQGSLQDLDSMSFDYAYLQLTAAKDYPNACHNGYKRFTGLAYPVELARREAQLEHLCDVALGIVDHLG